MKLIVAIINPNRLEYVTSALRRARVPGCTVTAARGFGKEAENFDWNLSGELTDKVRLEIVIEDESVSNILRAIQKAASTGKAGDGIIYVQDVLTSVRISFGTFTGMHKLPELEPNE